MKPGFLNTLRIEEIGEVKGRAIYSLLEDLLYRTGCSCGNGYGGGSLLPSILITDCGGSGAGVICVPKGFQTDLASVPRLPLIYAAWGDRAHREAVLHDYLYRKNSVPICTRAEADNYFKLAMISRHQPWHIYYPMWVGVRAFGGSAYHKRKVGENRR